MRSVFAVGLGAAGALLGVFVTIGLNRAVSMGGPMGISFSPVAELVGTALAVGLVLLGRAVHPGSLRAIGHVVVACAFWTLVHVGDNAWQFPTDDGAFYSLKTMAMGGGYEGLIYPSAWQHTLAFAMTAAWLYAGVVLGNARQWASSCAMQRWGIAARSAVVAAAAALLLAGLGASYIQLAALAQASDWATHWRTWALPTPALGFIGLLAHWAWRKRYWRLVVLVGVAGFAWLLVLCTTLGGYFDVMRLV
ncbi:hypothetical protein [Acidovorax sp.]|uniref:hypothetical protein n=1 Tax=Acidovorax sp. TaxID=1872122 RepID=UPI0039190887